MFEKSKICPEKNELKQNQCRNILLEIIEDKNREINLNRGNVLDNERNIKKLSRHQRALEKLLEIYGINDVTIEQVGENLYKIKISQTENLELSHGYAYKGGMAREILNYELGITAKIETRDIDIVRVIDSDIYGFDEKIAQELSEDDYQQGHGVEELENDYFESRDFTISEVLVINNDIYLSRECLLDTIRGIIRFSEYEKKEYWGDYNESEDRVFINDKLLAKAIRFCAFEVTRGREAYLADSDVYRYLDINDFHIALHLDRAFEQGSKVAEEYIVKLIEMGQLPSDVNNPEIVMQDIIGRVMENNSFIFQHAPLELFNKKDEIDTLYSKYGEYEEQFDNRIDRKTRKNKYY